MKEALVAALGGLQSLAQDDTREVPVDRLGAVALAQIAVGRARGEAHLVSLGRDLIAVKFGRQPRYHASATEKLTIVLGWPQYRLKMREMERRNIALWALIEWLQDACDVCHGRLEVPMGPVDRDGAIPMKPCQSCSGTGKRRYTDQERMEALPDIPRTGRALMVASTTLHEAERLAVAGAARMLERW